MRAGSVLVDHGARAYIDHGQLAPQAAIDDIEGRIAADGSVLPDPALSGIDLGPLIASLHAAAPVPPEQ